LNNIQNINAPGVSYYYAPSNHFPYGTASQYSMTAAAAWNYVLIHDGVQHSSLFTPAGLTNIETNMENALTWLSSRTPFDLSLFAQNRYYYAFTIAKAISMSNREAFFGDWYGTLSSGLIADQANGLWTHLGSWGIPDETETGFAVAALQVNQENPLTPAAKAFILNSHADLHVYDFRGNHTGYSKLIEQVE
jgi:hypothetical protein